MEKAMPERFNAFHLEVACCSERLRFALEALEVAGADAVGCGVLRALLDDLDSALEAEASFYPGEAVEAATARAVVEVGKLNAMVDHARAKVWGALGMEPPPLDGDG